MIQESRVNEVERRLNNLLERVSMLERMAAAIMDRLNAIAASLNSPAKR